MKNLVEDKDYRILEKDPAIEKELVIVWDRANSGLAGFGPYYIVKHQGSKKYYDWSYEAKAAYEKIQ